MIINICAWKLQQHRNWYVFGNKASITSYQFDYVNWIFVLYISLKNNPSHASCSLLNFTLLTLKLNNEIVTREYWGDDVLIYLGRKHIKNTIFLPYNSYKVFTFEMGKLQRDIGKIEIFRETRKVKFKNNHQDFDHVLYEAFCCNHLKF